MNVILSTRNPSKTEQIKEIFAGSQISILTLAEAGIDGEAIENGMSLRVNALKKADFAHAQSHGGMWAMADDTGLFIEVLDGRPGIHAARWAGETATTDEITQHTLRQLAGKAYRQARFITVVAVVSPSGSQHVFEGCVQGTILEKPRCEPQPKMPYSAIFLPDGSDKVWAEMTVAEENAISHRGIAFGRARKFLEEQMATLLKV